MDVTQAETLADQICGCANREQHRRDVAFLNEAFAAHRQAALLEGIRVGIEACADAAVGYIHPDYPRLPGEPFATAQIRAIDPAAVLARHGGA